MKAPNLIGLSGAAFALLLAAGCMQQQAAAPPPAPKVERACDRHTVHFQTGGVLMEPADISTINALTRESMGPAATILLIGKTDKVGSKSANMQLSKKRAELVRSALIDNGVLAQKITATYTGEKQPEVQTRDEEAEPLNRTVVAIVNDGGCMIPK